MQENLHLSDGQRWAMFGSNEKNTNEKKTLSYRSQAAACCYYKTHKKAALTAMMLRTQV